MSLATSPHIQPVLDALPTLDKAMNSPFKSKVLLTPQEKQRSLEQYWLQQGGERKVETIKVGLDERGASHYLKDLLRAPSPEKLAALCKQSNANVLNIADSLKTLLQEAFGPRILADTPYVIDERADRNAYIGPLVPTDVPFRQQPKIPLYTALMPIVLPRAKAFDFIELISPFLTSSHNRFSKANSPLKYLDVEVTYTSAAKKYQSCTRYVFPWGPLAQQADAGVTFARDNMMNRLLHPDTHEGQQLRALSSKP